jgi:hypothetical protein
LRAVVVFGQASKGWRAAPIFPGDRMPGAVRIDGSRRVPVEALEIYVALLDQEETADAKAS